MSKQTEQKWYLKKRFYIPLSILLGLIGFSPMFSSLLGVKHDDEFNPDFYTDKDAPMFKKKDSD
ncbi:hypothetical protein [Enterococcus sp. AZ109]|uniref:hypothetical protein n=1 Tax=Enterococcus sp. AZ109 TaxID=2774634 RepID=UPI003F261D62